MSPRGRRPRRMRPSLRSAKPQPITVHWRDGDVELDAARVYTPTVAALAARGDYVAIVKRVADLDLAAEDARHFVALLGLATIPR